jgi:outer membrane protein TolC
MLLPYESGAAPLSLEQARDLALHQASELTQAELDVRTAEEDVRQARQAFLPILGSTFSYLYTTPLRGTGPGEPSIPSLIANNAVHELVLLATATGSIDLSGKLRATLDHSRAQLARAQAQALVTRRGLLSAVAQGYYGLSLARAKMRVAKEALESARSFLHTTELRFHGGEVPQADAVKARLEVDTRTDELLQARAGELEASDTLLTLIGAGPDTTLEIEDLDDTSPRPAERRRYNEEDVRKRPEFAALAADERAAADEVRLAKAERRPSLSYTLSAGVDDASLDPKNDLGASASAALEVPLFDGGAARSRLRQAEIRIEAAQRSHALVERTLLQKLHTALAQVDLAAERAGVASLAVVESQKSLEISLARYASGEAPVFEVSEARSTLAAARTAYYQALFDYSVALDQLEQSVGR